MRVTFDSNAWEALFDNADVKYALVRDAIEKRSLQGFICNAAFRIEAIRKKERAAYFAKPHMGMQSGFVEHDGKPYFLMSFGPEDDLHPGIPVVQTEKLQRALEAGILLIRGQNWMGLPSPVEVKDPTLFVPETLIERYEREQRQIEVSAKINALGVGYRAFEEAGGWDLAKRPTDNPRKLQSACAEWADGELAAAHVAYQNDILCSGDFGRSAGNSIFNTKNRDWLKKEYKVDFCTLEDLMRRLKDRR